jgi:hypothetical protein
MLNRLTKLLKKPDQPATSVDWDAFVEQSIKEDVDRKRAFASKPQRTWIQSYVTHPIRRALYTLAWVVLAALVLSFAAIGIILAFSGPRAPSVTRSHFVESDSVSAGHRDSEAPGKVWVEGYTRKNGTKVKGYWRSK